MIYFILLANLKDLAKSGGQGARGKGQRARGKGQRAHGQGILNG
jgi:hypothetical protein